eukprot:TsM_000817700 transcript=TsM_000817700 gene=TsM_000817700
MLRDEVVGTYSEALLIVAAGAIPLGHPDAFVEDEHKQSPALTTSLRRETFSGSEVREERETPKKESIINTFKGAWHCEHTSDQPIGDLDAGAHTHTTFD